jgi:outer membrane protein TolC/ABC-type uncharacterized transport system substrate-binding protein
MFLTIRSFRQVATYAVLVLVCVACPQANAQGFTVAVVDDGPGRLALEQSKFVDELLVLTESEFDVEIRRFTANWNRESIEQALADAYSDPDVDMVLVTGFIANQFTARRDAFPKPTFLPVLLDTTPLGPPSPDGLSGIRNLSYLTAFADFDHSLDALAGIISYENLAIMYDRNFAESIPSVREAATAVAGGRGIRLIEVEHDGINHQLMDQLPPETDAVFVSALPRMPQADFELLVAAINEAGLPSYSFVGVSDVEAGLLVTNSEPRDTDRQARLNALNMQAVMLGERPEDQPTQQADMERITINMATARAIGVSPRFDVLNSAVLLNADEDASGPQIGLVEIARLALANNQDLRAETFGTQAGLEDIARARSNLLPQLDAQVGHTRRKNSPAVSAGLGAESSDDAALSVSQLLYSDAAVANLRIQKELQRNRLATLHEFELDVVRAATTAYYIVLNADSQLEVQENNLKSSRSNLELAEDRVRLGISTPADVYRWKAEVARARILVVSARSALDQAWDSLNRILHRPQGARFGLREASFNEPFVMTRAEFDTLVDNPSDYEKFSRYYIQRARRQAPELEQLNALIVAKRRELKSAQRAYWLPDFSIGGQYTNNFGQSGGATGPLSGEGLSDWNFGIQATLPLFSGGLKKANMSKADYELRQLESLRISTEERVEQEIRSQLHEARAAYASIDLTSAAADASRKNFELVSDAYARGTVSVIELLDAQDTSREATAGAIESLYGFLITIMSMQRAIGGYDFLLSPEERNQLANEMRTELSGGTR